MTSNTPAESNPSPAPGSDPIDQAVAQGGAYEVLRRRLSDQGRRLRDAAERMNARRVEEFGSSTMEVIGRVRVRTDNNCIGRDIVQVGHLILFGYNVFIGLKTSTRIEDVFGLYQLVSTEDGFDVVPVELAGSFLGDPQFTRDFTELYAYYKNARLLQLVVRDGRLLASFQIGERTTDVRVFRWSLTPGGEATYIDARGERDLTMPPAFDFEWTRATRELMVNGRHPHLNVLDTLFVETTGGDLTIKVEDNTESGQGIHSEPVEDKTQSLDDATFDFARVGSLVLLKVLPYREDQWRGFIYNTLTGRVQRNDAIIQACVQLPEDHGIIFPGGYYLQNGEHKAFDAAMSGMQFKRAIRSPNGEDVLYIFYDQVPGRSALFVYNMIQRQLHNPVFGHGYARLADGRMVIFHAEGDGPTRIHPMQAWQTPFVSDEFAASRPESNTYLGRLGNAELVRGISNLVSLAREIGSEEVSLQRYQLLVRDTRKLFDAHHWIDDAHCDGVASLVREIAATGESVLDEFEKVQGIRRQSAQAMADARDDHAALVARLLPENWTQVQEFVDALNEITRQRGHLLTIREHRYIDVPAIDALGAELQVQHERVAAATGVFLASDTALAPYLDGVVALDGRARSAETATELAESLAALQAMSSDLDMLSELMATLKVDDPAQRTRVVEAVSAIYSRLNQARARAEQRRRALGSAEAVAQFGAQFTLFGQAITGALGLATDPEKADEQLSRLMVQLEELESQFGEHERFLGDILTKREELLETFDAHKQALLDDRHRKAQSVLDAADRILSGLGKRTEKFSSPDELNAFFAGDPLILKVRELAERLRSLKDSVKADDVEARLKGARDQAVRALRDRVDLFEGDGQVIRLGRHRFSVNTQPLDLTILPRGDRLALHLTGTDFMEPIEDARLAELREYWQLGLESESPALYRAEYLAGELVAAASAGSDGLDDETLQKLASDPDALARAVREFAAPRYRDGYERGIHDHDAALILRAFLAQRDVAGNLIHAPAPRALATLLLASHGDDADVAQWEPRAAGALAMHRLFGSRDSLDALRADMATRLAGFAQERGLPFDASCARAAADFLSDHLTSGEPGLVLSRQGRELAEMLESRLASASLQAPFQHTLDLLEDRPDARWQHVLHWLQALCNTPAAAAMAPYVPESAAWILARDALSFRDHPVALTTTVEGLLGDHPRISDGRMELAVDDLLARLRVHRERFVPGFRRYHQVRNEVAARERTALRLGEFQARPLSSFVRNKLINEVYLPIIGDNLAKQMGTAGEGKRSDLMGLLMMISPPGYGKTTLMEYVASRLGLVFMKINGPALGHEVRSVDPAQAPDATSRQELEKLNLAFEMGNNVMLYVDDIQHTHPEFLQKFISLCDGTRRVEGVWKGRTRTYDMRGKKFCVVMAGNPYTESGEVFKIPDMLANRADIYNLGDVLGGVEDTFTLSYVENSLTSSPLLAPLATRDLADLHRLVDKARGEQVSATDLSHAYSAAEINEFVETLVRVMKVRDVVYRVNQQYIASAAQADKYRTEPAFKLQGSYRNMNKLVEKISPVMNEGELQQLISDHYQGEAQLLTVGAEENLLKLKELRGVLTATEQARWAQIKHDFLRNKAMGAEDADVGGRVVAQLADIAGGLQAMGSAVAGPAGDAPAASESPPWKDALALLERVVADRRVDAPRPGTDDVDALVKTAIQPLVAAIHSSQGHQDQLSNAMLHLASAIRARMTARPPTGRAPHTPTPEERRLDEALARLHAGLADAPAAR
ncbi:DNA repair ATPase [Lysobacter sp. A3-1-A15]|uniref:DNA repair ATPase n=1 Tax=Novilysobacter viscosus TaxID=3098602 RepID=UPI002ED8F1C4